MHPVWLSVSHSPLLIAGGHKLTASSPAKTEISPYKNFAYTFADSFLTKPDLYRELLLTTASENIH